MTNISESDMDTLNIINDIRHRCGEEIATIYSNIEFIEGYRNFKSKRTKNYKLKH